MSSQHMAQRTHGVCRGTLYRHCDNKKKSSSSSSINEFCVLVGVRLSTYESLEAYERGDHPLVTMTIVGVSSASSQSKDHTSSFRVVTNQGSQMNCRAPTSSCREVWLSTLQAALECKLLITTSPTAPDGQRLEDDDDETLLPKVKLPSRYRNLPGKFCASCGKIERHEFPIVADGAPLAQYGIESRADLCLKCWTAQGVLDHVQFIRQLYSSATQERQALLQAREVCLMALVSKDKLKEIKQQQEPKKDGGNPKKGDDQIELEINDVRLNGNSSWALSNVIRKSAQFAACQRVSPTLVSFVQQYQQGIVDVMEFMEGLDHAVGKRDDHFRDLKKQAIRVAGDMGTAMKLLLEQALPHQLLQSSPSSAGNKSNTLSPDGIGGDDSNTEMLQCLLEFFLDLATDGELNALAFFWPQLCYIHLRMLPPENAAELARVELFEDFLLTIATKYSIHLAMELIWHHIADLEDANVASGSLTDNVDGGSADGYTAALSAACRKRRFAVLKFLCELESLLFDFEHGWGGGSMCVGQMMSPSAHQNQKLLEGIIQIQRYRQYSTDQLSRSARRFKFEKERFIQKESNKEKQHLNSNSDDNHQDDTNAVSKLFTPESLAQEALRIAKNADYVSSHLAFTKRLCDIAERLRFMPVDQRSMTLSAELAKLNASGSMGGDPLNIVRSDYSQDECNHHHPLARVVRIPTTEGHVFRSKERTPVLLLMETVDEAAMEEAKDASQGAGSVEEDTNQDETSTNEASNYGAQNGKAEVIESCKEPLTNGTKAHGDDEEQNCMDTNGVEDVGHASVPTADNGQNEESEGVPKDAADRNEPNSVSEPSSEPDIDKDDGSTVLPSQVDDEEFPGELKSISTQNITRSHSDTLPIRKSSSMDSSNLEGSMNFSSQEALHALRRFDSPIKGESTIVTPTPSKVMVEEMVTNVVAKQLQLPSLVLPETNSSPQPEKKDDIKKDSTDQGDKDNSQDRAKTSKKMSTLGVGGGGDSVESSLAKTGDTRREVLKSIMTKGMTGSNTIAAGAATAVQRQLMELERRRAVELLLTGEEPTELLPDANSVSQGESKGGAESTRQELLSLGIRSASSDHLGEEGQPSDEDEVMEAVRLLLIQYKVAQGTISAGAAAQALAPPRMSFSDSLRRGSGIINKFDPREMPHIDAGDVDPRLIGCGTLPPAVLQALTLWKGSMVSNGELLELVKKDLEYVRQSGSLEAKKDKLIEDSLFWGRFAFGERWAEKRSRIAATSPEASQPGWDLLGVIIKSNDDLRQESFVMQLIELCREAFQEAGLELWLHPYRILSTGRSTGIIEMVRNAMSFDALKKRPGYGKGGLREHLQRMCEFTADPGEAFKSAQQNFVRSLAAYSLLSYLFLFKDRHNGNILLDTAGHVIHIDFGFVFGIAPGGSFSLEMSTPFKLTEEMIDVMDGLRSSLFSEFVTLFCCGFLALQAHCDTFLTIVEITCNGSSFKCFEGKDSTEVVSKLRERFCPDLGKEDTIAFALDIIKQSTHSYGTAQYDYFQYLSQGIAT